MKCRKADRCPVRGQHLDVRKLGEAIGRECEGKPRNERGVVPSRQRIRQEVRAERAQHISGEQGHVVAQQGATRQRDERRRDWRLAEQVLGERQRTGGRIEHRRIPPVRRQGDGLGRPPEDPRIQDRIAGIVGNAVHQPDRQRPRIGDRQRDVGERGGGDRPSHRRERPH